MKEKTFSLSSKERQKILRLLICELVKQKDIVFAYVYGSFLDSLPCHDIDIGVYLDDTIQTSTINRSLELTAILNQRLTLPVDVRIINHAPVAFIYSVLRGQLLFERDANVRVWVTADAVRRYLDIKPLYHRAMKEAFDYDA